MGKRVAGLGKIRREELKYFEVLVPEKLLCERGNFVENVYNLKMGE